VPLAPQIGSCVGELRDILSRCAEDPSRADAMILGAVRAFGLAVFEAFLDERGRRTPHGAPDGYRATTVCTVLGHAKYSRAYYAPLRGRGARQARRRALREAAAGQAGGSGRRGGYPPRTGGAPCACPLDAALGKADGMTPAMRDYAQRAAAAGGSFAEGAEALARFAGVPLSESTFRRKALAAGARAIAAQTSPALRLLLPFIPAWLLAATVATIPTLYIMLDGTGVPCVRKDTEGVRGKGPDGTAGTREIKVAVVGTFRRLDAKGRPVRDPGCESHIASASSAAEFGILLRKLADSRGYGSALRVQIVGDGADWIANIVRNAFPGREVIFTVDFYHTCEYLQAFLARAGLDPAATARSFSLARSVMRRHGGAAVLRHLLKRYPALADDPEAADALAYIRKRQHAMDYGSYRKRGLYIGSGVVEAACRTTVARRCKQSGMHWRLHNAAAMCALVARFRSNLSAA